MNNITLADVKLALKDKRFRDSLPTSFKEDILKWEKNPGCGCNIPLYKKIILDAKDQLKNYYPDKVVIIESSDIKQINNFYVINCSILELEKNLKSLSPGRKQVAIARYEDQVTVLINDLD
jgi:hypothetical protein